MSVFVVEVVSYGTDTVVYRSKETSERRAERIDDGLNINLDHENYFTRIVEIEDS